MIKNTEFLKQVEEFHILMQQPVVQAPSEMPEDRNKLRIALLFEELKEYAEASGLLDHFNELCDKFATEWDAETNINEIAYVPVVDLVEQLDALADLQYVLSGTVLENGFGDVFLDAFNEVQRSNMSKVDSDVFNAQLTQDKYKKDNITVISKQHIPTGNYITYRESDMKVLKSHKYSPADLTQFIK